MVNNGAQLPITYAGKAHLFPMASQLVLKNVFVIPFIKKESDLYLSTYT